WYAKIVDASNPSVFANSNSFNIVATAISSSSCVRKNPTVSVSPSSQAGNPGQTLTYTLKVTNNDSSGCEKSIFLIDNPSSPSYFYFSYTGSLELKPGETGTTNINVKIDSATPNNTYTSYIKVKNYNASSYSSSTSFTTKVISITISIEDVQIQGLTDANNNGYLDWPKGTTQKITWNSSNIDTVDIIVCQYDANNKTTCWTFCSQTGSCAKAIPASKDYFSGWVNWSIGTRGYIEVRKSGSTTPYARKSFEVVKATPSISNVQIEGLTLNYEGYEFWTWPEGTVKKVTWTSSSDVSYVEVRVCDLSGSCLTPAVDEKLTMMAPTIKNVGYTNVYLPRGWFTNKNVYIKIRDPYNNIEAKSVTFKVISLPIVNVRITDLNGNVLPKDSNGNYIASSSKIRVTWDSRKDIDKVNIRLTKFGDPSDTISLAENVNSSSGSGSYTFTLNGWKNGDVGFVAVGTKDWSAYNVAYIKASFSNTTSLLDIKDQLASISEALSSLSQVVNRMLGR
ncbi:MAG TPA: hypothetical protein PK121_01715, partial [Candidatus Pacearchaeota archaeon]|nr:hypothetical protein [Candidatus Pacearchaeota archaeon]